MYGTIPETTALAKFCPLTLTAQPRTCLGSKCMVWRPDDLIPSHGLCGLATTPVTTIPSPAPVTKIPSPALTHVTTTAA